MLSLTTRESIDNRLTTKPGSRPRPIDALFGPEQARQIVAGTVRAPQMAGSSGRTPRGHRSNYVCGVSRARRAAQS